MSTLSRSRGSRRLVVHCKREGYDVYIGRPSDWGNPFSHLPASAAKWRVATREESIRKYEEWLLEQPELLERVRQELRGKVLGCWCSPLPCHGDVLARIANAPEPEGR
jgi:hypothetical protein